MDKIRIVIFGLASNSTYKTIEILPHAPFTKHITVLDFLRSHGVPVASSCQGQAQCYKCVTAQQKLTCDVYLDQIDTIAKQISENDYQIDFSYL